MRVLVAAAGNTTMLLWDPDCNCHPGEGVFCHDGHPVFLIYFCFVLFCFLGPHPRHMEVPRLGVKLEPQLLAYTTATATQDPSHVCDLYHSSEQCWILNPLSKARD